jgi:hypothetical protein
LQKLGVDEVSGTGHSMSRVQSVASVG